MLRRLLTCFVAILVVAAPVAAQLCAPSAKCRLTKAGAHAGAVYCDSVRTEEITFVCSDGAGSPSGAFLD